VGDETFATPEEAAVSGFPPTFARVEGVTYSRGVGRAKAALLTNEGPCYVYCKRDESGRWSRIRITRRRDSDWQPGDLKEVFQDLRKVAEWWWFYGPWP
jgi:hypothetical protein